jgi:hypothetical protein
MISRRGMEVELSMAERQIDRQRTLMLTLGIPENIVDMLEFGYPSAADIEWARQEMGKFLKQ